MAKVLVTGGAGFIGSHLVRALLDRGDHVRVLDNFSSGFHSNLEDLPIDLIEGDIRDADLVRQSVQEIDLVFHLAAMVSVPESMQDPTGCYESNVMGSLHLLRAAHRNKVQKVVLSSSCALYGNAQEAVDEQARVQPLSPYAESKHAMEGVATLFQRVYGLPAVCLRYFNVYGPRQSPQSQYAAAIPIFIDRLQRQEAPIIHGDGLQTRNFVYVGDVVRANLLAAQRRDAVGIFNIAGDESISIKQLVTTLETLLPGAPPAKHGPARPGDVRHSAAKTEKVVQALGFHPEIALEQGLQRTIQWFAQEAQRANR